MVGLDMRGLEVRVGGEAGKMGQVRVRWHLKSSAKGTGLSPGPLTLLLFVCHKNALKIRTLGPLKISVQWARGRAWISAFLTSS